MKIRINGADADIQLETEKTVGEVLSALDAWITGTGHRLSGLGIDGLAVNTDSMETCFGKPVDTVDTLDIYTNSVLELFAESLLRVLQDINIYETAGFEEKDLFIEQWKKSPEALLLAEQNQELFDRITKTFSGFGSGAQALRMLVEERLCELQNPADEIDRIQPLVTEVCSRLEELPLDIQTGKDARAAETVNAFSGIAEKVFRIFKVLKLEGFHVESITVGDMLIAAYITEFSTALGEMLTAFEQHDTVLMGDLAEYEMAPRFRSLYAAIMDATKSAVINIE
jgi:hypothetical protein